MTQFGILLLARLGFNAGKRESSREELSEIFVPLRFRFASSSSDDGLAPRAVLAPPPPPLTVRSYNSQMGKRRYVIHPSISALLPPASARLLHQPTHKRIMPSNPIMAKF